MDFARRQLEKYGWKEGQGLGKNEDGITKPIKASLKFDNTGVGHKPGAEYNNRWWETLYDKAAQNLEVVKLEDGTVKLSRKADAVELATNNYSINNGDKDGLYGSFIKTSRLTSKGTDHYNRAPVIEEQPFKVLTDEELFAACGGVYLHNGTRRSIHSKGKLARLEDKTFLEKMRKLKSQTEAPKKKDINGLAEKTEKKRRKSVPSNDTVLECQIPSSECSNVNTIEEGIKQEKNQDNDIEGSQFITSDLPKAKKKKLKKRRKLEGSESSNVENIPNSFVENESLNTDEGIENGIEQEKDRDVEGPQFIDSDLSKAEKKKLKKKRKLEGLESSNVDNIPNSFVGEESLNNEKGIEEKDRDVEGPQFIDSDLSKSEKKKLKKKRKLEGQESLNNDEGIENSIKQKKIVDNDVEGPQFIDSDLSKAEKKKLKKKRKLEGQESLNNDEGIENSIKQKKNEDNDVEGPQFIDSDLSKAEKKKLKKLRKLEGKQSLTENFNLLVKDEDTEDISSKQNCKKRKLNFAESEFSECKGSQSEADSSEIPSKKQKKEKKDKKNKKSEKHGTTEE